MVFIIAINIRSTPSFGWEVKVEAQCHNILWHVKITCKCEQNAYKVKFFLLSSILPTCSQMTAGSIAHSFGG
jgi:hypothetical protein